MSTLTFPIEAVPQTAPTSAARMTIPNDVGPTIISPHDPGQRITAGVVTLPAMPHYPALLFGSIIIVAGGGTAIIPVAFFWGGLSQS